MGGTTHPSLLFALTYGFLTALTPCVYPMIPITISIFGARTGVPRRRAVVLATCYVAGIAVMFGALGTTFALLGKAFGTFLANPWFIVPLSLFFFAMGLSMFGAFEISLPSGLQARLSRVGGRGFFGAFLMGLVGGIIAAPCTGPPLASLLAYVATTRDAVWGMALLATYGAGVGLPFFLLAAFSLSLPKPGPWMDFVKFVFGVALFVAALYYLKNVVPILETFTLKSSVFFWVHGGLMLSYIVVSLLQEYRRTVVAKALRAMILTGLVFGFVNSLLTPKGGTELAWMTDESAAVADARAKDRPLIVDFSASWCLPCKELELQVFSRPEVAEKMRQFTLLKLDLTREEDDTRLAPIKKKYETETLPAVRIIDRDGKIVARVDQFVPAEQFRKLLEAAKP